MKGIPIPCVLSIHRQSIQALSESIHIDTYLLPSSLYVTLAISLHFHLFSAPIDLRIHHVKGLNTSIVLFLLVSEQFFKVFIKK